MKAKVLKGIFLLGVWAVALPLQATILNDWPHVPVASTNDICLDPLNLLSASVPDGITSSAAEEKEAWTNTNIPEASKSERVSISCVFPVDPTIEAPTSRKDFSAAQLKGELSAIEFVDHFIPFLFRTKKSESLGKVDVIIHISQKGKLTNYEVISDVDKGLKQRLNYVFRKMPNWKPAEENGEGVPMNFLVSIALQ